MTSKNTKHWYQIVCYLKKKTVVLNSIYFCGFSVMHFEYQQSLPFWLRQVPPQPVSMQ